MTSDNALTKRNFLFSNKCKEVKLMKKSKIYRVLIIIIYLSLWFVAGSIAGCLTSAGLLPMQ